jgi:RNA polymerase sigma factor (sigma-70 family)
MPHATPTVPFLDRATELDLIGRWQAQACPSARARIVAAYQPLVRRIARSYHRRFLAAVPLALGDLVQEGHIGLLTALDRFDAGLGHRFGTYAQWWIAASMRTALRGAGVPPRRAEAAETRAPTLLPLDAVLKSGEEGGSFLDQLSDGGAALEAALETRQADQLRFILTGLLDSLDATLRRIVVERFCTEDTRPRSALASELGLSVYEVRSGENRALDVLRRGARAHGLSAEDLQPT